MSSNRRVKSCDLKMVDRDFTTHMRQVRDLRSEERAVLMRWTASEI